MHLGIIKITYNRTATHFMDDRFVNLGKEVIPTLLWQSGASESVTVCFVIYLNICYWLFKCGVLHIVCACVCERERERERVREGHSAVSCVCVCVCVCARACVRAIEGDTVTSQLRLVCKHIRASSPSCIMFPSLAWTDGKTKDMINCLCIYFESWSSQIMERDISFPMWLVLFGQSQCSGSVGQSEETALVRRRDFVENV